MADKKISALTAATTPLAGTEVLPIVQSGSTVKVANNDLRPKQIQSNATSGVLQVVGPAAAATRIMTVPDANFTAARTDAAQSFTGDQTLGTGNLVQGTAARGVNFTANTPAAGMTSQLLNAYEEGTWTPVLSDGTNNATMSTSTQGHYTRIGNTVFYRARVRLTSLGSVSGSVRVTGLPFTVANVDSNYGGGNTIGFAADLNITAGYAVSQIPVNTTTYVSLYLWDTTTGSTALQASEMTNTSDIYFSGQYQI